MRLNLDLARLPGVRALALLAAFASGPFGCASAPAPLPPPAPPPPAKPAPAPVAKAEPAPPAPVTQDAPFRAEQPKGGPAPVLVLPKVQHKTLKNGLQIVLVENHALPIVAMRLIVPAGGEKNPADKAGLADLTAEMLDEGTKTRGALEIAEALESIGARLGTGASQDAAFVSLTTLSSQLGKALDVFAEVATAPAFKEEDFSRVRDRTKTSLLQSKDAPAAIAGRAFSRVLYGDKHPYAFPTVGTEKSIEKITRADLEKFHALHYLPNTSKVVVVGDVTIEQAAAELERRLGAWRGSRSRASGATGKAPKAKAPPTPKDVGRRVVLVDKEGASQSVVRIGHVGVPRKHPDYAALLVMNDILGGSFTSRINLNLREKKGYTYGARSGYSMLRGAGPFSAGGNVKADVTRESIDELLKELDGIRKGKVTDEELGEAKSGLVARSPARFETNASTAGELADVLIHDLPEDDIATMVQRIQAVTADDVLRVAKKYVRPESAVIVVVGDRKSVEPKLSGLGKIEHRDARGEPVSDKGESASK